MRRLLLACTVFLPAVAIATGSQAAEAQDSGPKVGDMAPDFTVKGSTKDGLRSIHLQDFRGQTVVLAFFPKARTSGCTAQLESYRDQYSKLFNNGKGVAVIAISTDDDTVQMNWARDKSFPVLFASDAQRTVGKQYDVLWNLVLTKLEKRVLFVVGPDGRVTHIMRPFKEMVGDSYTELGAEVAKSLRSQAGKP